MTSDRPRGGSALYLAGVCLMASLGGLLAGFDTVVISGTVERIAVESLVSVEDPDTLDAWRVSVRGG